MDEKKISPSSWKKQAARVLATLKPAEPDHPKRVAILGIGNPLNGDDAVGGYIADKLLSRQSNAHQNPELELKVINSGPIPENFSGVLRRFAPGLIIMVDAAQLGENPGSIRWIPLEDISGFSASTHGMPLSLFTSYLLSDINCQIALLGIQPEDITPGLSEKPNLTPGVKKAANDICLFLMGQFSSIRP